MIPETVRLTVAQAVVTFLARQYSAAEIIPTTASAQDGGWHQVTPVPDATFGHD